MSKQVNYDLDEVAFIAQFGYDASGFSKDDLWAVSLAVELADLDIDYGRKPDDRSDYEHVAAYVGSCIENDFNR